MENIQNNNTSNQPTVAEQTTQNVPPVTDANPANQQAPAANTSVPGNNSKKKFFIVFLIIFLLITAMMIFLMMNNKNTTPIEAPVTTIPTQAPSSAPSPSSSIEEQEVNSIDIEDTSPTEFPDIEKDIQSL